MMPSLPSAKRSGHHQVTAFTVTSAAQTLFSSTGCHRGDASLRARYSAVLWPSSRSQ
jgi:hypothetical protein